MKLRFVLIRRALVSKSSYFYENKLTLIAKIIVENLKFNLRKLAQALYISRSFNLSRIPDVGIVLRKFPDIHSVVPRVIHLVLIFEPGVNDTSP